MYDSATRYLTSRAWLLCGSEGHSFQALTGHVHEPIGWLAKDSLMLQAWGTCLICHSRAGYPGFSNSAVPRKACYYVCLDQVLAWHSSLTCMSVSVTIQDCQCHLNNQRSSSRLACAETLSIMTVCSLLRVLT